MDRPGQKHEGAVPGTSHQDGLLGGLVINLLQLGMFMIWTKTHVSTVAATDGSQVSSIIRRRDLPTCGSCDSHSTLIPGFTGLPKTGVG